MPSPDAQIDRQRLLRILRTTDELNARLALVLDDLKHDRAELERGKAPRPRLVLVKGDDDG